MANSETELAVGRVTTTFPKAPHAVPFTVAVNVSFVTRFVGSTGDVELELLPHAESPTTSMRDKAAERRIKASV
jgi:hypothetical protein